MFKRISMIVVTAMILQAVSFGTVWAAPDDPPAPGTAAPYVSTIPTPQGNSIINPNYDRSWDDYTVVSESGLKHPGVLHSRTDLNVIRDMVWLGQEPWVSGFEKLRTSPEAAKDVIIYGKGGTQQEFVYEAISDSNGDKQLRQDATIAYQQALMWYITGDDVYADNAIAVLDAWAEGLKDFFGTTEPANWDDVAAIWGASSVLSSGVAGQKMAAAAEILLYTPSSGWLRDENGNIDYAAKTKYDNFFRLIWKESNKWYGFFNQAAVGNKGYLSISVFLDDINGYNEAVERFAVNKKAVDAANEAASTDPAATSLNFSVAAMLLDNGQIVEMGRDQPHAADDVGALAGAARTIYLQGTQLDPVTGVPVETGGVNPYEFQDQKLLKMISYFSKYNLGFDVDFIPNKNGLGQRTEWSNVSVSGRGAYAEMVSIYNYYKYIAGYEGAQYEELYHHPEIMMEKGFPEGGSIDRPGFGQLLFTPVAGAWNTAPKGPPQPVVNENGSNYELYGRHSVIPFSSNNQVFFKNGFVKPGVASYIDEDGAIQYKAEGTMNNNWIGFEGYDFGDQPIQSLAYTYSVNSPAGSVIQLYVTEPEVKLTDETMAQTQPFAQFTVPNTGWWTTVNTHVHRFTGNTEQLTGIKNIYFKISGSSNAYNLAAETFWFQFSGAYARTDNKASEAPLKSASGYATHDNGQTATLTNNGYIGYSNMNFDRGTRLLQLNHAAAGSGTLEMRLGSPDGQLVKAYPIADTAGGSVVTNFEHEEAEIVYGFNQGNNDLYLVYKGTGNISINSFKYADVPLVAVADPTKKLGGNYFVDNGKAVKSGDNVIMQGDDALVVYQSVNTGARNGERGFMAIKVKSNEAMTLKVRNLLQWESTQNPIVASFNIPDTDGQFITLAYDLSQSGYQNQEGMMYLRLETSGGTSDSRAEIEYFTFNNDEIEFVEALDSVTISSSNTGNAATATAGDTITLSFTATEALEGIEVYFGNTVMPVITVNEEATSFKVEQTLGENYYPGPINFRIHYNVAGGFGKSVYETTDGSAVTIVDEPGLLTSAFKQAVYIDSTPGRSADTTKQITDTLFDRTKGTFSDYRVAGNLGNGAWIAFDFGLTQKVKIDKAKLLARDGFGNRAQWAVLQGKNHWEQEQWVDITTTAANTLAWQTLTGNNNSNIPYRYIRVFNGTNWFGNIDELKIFGTVVDIGEPVALTEVNIASNNAEDASYAHTGDTISLKFTAAEAITGVKAFINNQAVAVTTEDNLSFTAARTVTDADATGQVSFVIIYDDAPSIQQTTDGSSMYIVKELNSLLSKANSLEKNNYTRLSYHQFEQQLAQITEAMNEPNYSSAQLAIQLEAALANLKLQPIAAIYPFDENTNNVNGSMPAAITGNTTYMEGKMGQSLALDGSTHVTLTGAANLLDTNEVTIATWVYWNGGNQWQRIFDFGTGTNQYMFLSPRSGNNTLRFALKNGGAEQIVQTGQLAANEWVHVAVTLGSGTAKLYVNGVEQAANTNVTIKPSDFKPTLNYIGKAMFNDPMFNGRVDDFRLYNYALGAQDVEKLYHDQLDSMLDMSLLQALLDEALTVNQAQYTQETAAALQQAISAAQALQTAEHVAQSDIDQAATTLEAALHGLALKQAAQALLTGTEEAAPGEQAAWTLALTSPATFAIMDAVFKYDPTKIEFATVEDEGYLYLADTAIISQDDSINVLGAIVNTATSEIKVLANHTGGSAYSGPLFKLAGSVKQDATHGAAVTAVTGLSIAHNNEFEELETEHLQAAWTVVAAVEAVDKDELQALVTTTKALAASAQVGAAVAQYPAQAKASFEAAIAVAEGVLANEAATAHDVESAIAALAAAKTTFANSVNTQAPGNPVDQSVVTAAISDAQALLTNTVAGSKLGQYSLTAKTALQAAITKAQQLVNSGSASQNDVDAEAAALRNSMLQYNNSFISLVPGQTKITIQDLVILAKYFGVTSNDAEWSEIEAADVLNSQTIDIAAMAAIARMILENWVDQA
jgi:hypothetical protein